MPFLSDSFYNEKLKKYGLNIKTKYIVGNKILERNTNGSHNDDITNGIICSKEYFLNNVLIHTEKIFDSRIEYSFVSKQLENKEYTCINCGAHSNIKDFIDGCPYCNSKYNIDYTDKQLGGKYHYDLVLKNKTYRVVTAIIDIVLSFILAFIFIKLSSRTFNSYDISKIFIYGTILSLILYYFFYILDAYFILLPIKLYKEKQNKKQSDFWNETKIDKKAFFNNLNYEVRKKYYNLHDIIDYDILDYTKFEHYNKFNNEYIKVEADVRIILFKNNKTISKFIHAIYIMKKNEYGTIKLNNEINMIKCHNCGATIDASKGKCEYCGTEVKYLQEWIMDN